MQNYVELVSKALKLTNDRHDACTGCLMLRSKESKHRGLFWLTAYGLAHASRATCFYIWAAPLSASSATSTRETNNGHT